MPVDPTLLELLACPACHGGLHEEGATLVCRQCRLVYPVEDDIPVMLLDEARPLAD